MIEIGLNRGRCCDANSITSHDSRIEGSGGNTYVLRARNSFRMSFCSVPARRSGATPCRSAATRYIARMIGAVALIVKLTETSSSGEPSEQVRHVVGRVDRDADPPDLGEGGRVTGVVAELRRQVEGDGERRLAAVEQEAEPLVRLL